MGTTPRRTSTSIEFLVGSAIVAAVACGSQRPWGRAHVVEPLESRVAVRTIPITVSRTGFTPSEIHVRVGERVRLRFQRMAEGGCAREVIVSLDDSHEIRRPLPVEVPVELDLELDRPGELGYTCGMRMLGGTIDVRP